MCQGRAAPIVPRGCAEPPRLSNRLIRDERSPGATPLPTHGYAPSIVMMLRGLSVPALGHDADRASRRNDRRIRARSAHLSHVEACGVIQSRGATVARPVLAMRRILALGCFVALSAFAAADAGAAQNIVPPSIEVPHHLSLEQALHLVQTTGLDLLIAQASVRSAEGQLDASQSIANPVVS